MGLMNLNILMVLKEKQLYFLINHQHFGLVLLTDSHYY
ncbi:hypothetical protein FEM08_34160 [Flavobacterium gilvum]|nr:hypothetical protein FEM08_34160 [Flavobacterium gilvum]